MMTDKARAAFNELKNLGAPVMDWGGPEHGYGDHVAFVLIARSRDGTEVFACYRAEAIREQRINGRLINPHGVRQDVHEILAKHELVSDWYNPGQMVVYNDPDAPGMEHRFYFNHRF